MKTLEEFVNDIKLINKKLGNTVQVTRELQKEDTESFEFVLELLNEFIDGAKEFKELIIEIHDSPFTLKDVIEFGRNEKNYS